MFIEELKDGVVKVSATEDCPRPYIGVCGSMHGNEPCGGNAIERITQELKDGALRPGDGTLFLILGNPEAITQGCRHTPEGDDLNRLWDFSFTESLRQEAWGYEHHRVLDLKEVLGELDVFLDLHSAATSTPPFAVSNGVTVVDDVAKRIGVSFLVQSWYGLADKVIIGFLRLAGVPALSVECGAHDDPEISDKAYRIAISFLQVTGALSDRTEREGNNVRTVHVVETITKPSAEFRFGSPWTGFQELEPGVLVGRDRVTEIRATRRCYAVLPNESVEVGDDVIYLAVDA
ncbi:MAG: succinylglutamate desuccinylase/aspartoacylase family protein [Myxococcales bacterium]|nr:succinylglutamate desuccinylase/aspartoacylase family protein [Myxococcales bacterium]